MLATVSLAGAAEPLSDLGRELVWAEEFDAEGPVDPNRWTHEHGFQRNEEHQWYTPANAVCRDGLLRIEARRERVPNPQHDARSGDWTRQRANAEYTSSSIRTAGKYTWLYGVLEVRAKIDARPGLWPAIWTLGERQRWPSNGEVDVMEYYAGELLANACWNPLDGSRIRWDTKRLPVATLGGADWAKQFHVWRMEWDHDRIVLSVDDRVLNEIDSTTVPTSEGGVHPFRQPHYILLNLAIGGEKGGDPSETEFPASFEVDYVRVYQTPEQSSR